MHTKKQTTITKEVSFSGQALQTGELVKVTCKPNEADAGIVFKRVDMAGSEPVCLKDAVFSDSHQRRSTIGEGPWAIQTVEHFLAALWGLGIDNVLVEINGMEIPALDGSAREFINYLRAAGIKEQEPAKKIIKIREKETIEEGDRSITVFPSENFIISYFIDYKVASIGQETFELALDGETFEGQIAPARTFCLKAEAEMLLKLGFGKGATYDNTLVLDDTGPVGTKLRFPNEPVRHKILDLVGDLYMLGVPIIGRFEARKSGHSLNGKMLRKIYEKYFIKNDFSQEVVGKQ
ncbi:MAG: UDP-3-O-acyl-N-acetylglucosamine deacetylase [Candidatus Omnitrophica bacterium]|nr:UDP-3-O-acyl-N-acetylglucosamine deacetylase [Candidatus Omnitrophota bacterium]